MEESAVNIVLLGIGFGSLIGTFWVLIFQRF